MRRRKKAQVVIFESVLIFTIGVAIFIICYAVFSIYQSYFTSVSVEDQLDQTKDLIVANILMMAEKGNENNVNSSITLKIPRAVGSEEYKISLSNEGLNVSTLATGISKFSPLYNLNKSFDLSGSVPSVRGRIVIYKKGRQIII